MQQDSRPPNPPLTARIGQACYSYRCFKGDAVPLARCGRCRRVAYCSPECQKVRESIVVPPLCTDTTYQLDWNQHKPMCKTLNAIENSNLTVAAPLFFTIPSRPTTDVKRLHDLTEDHIAFVKGLCERSLNRPLTMAEGNLLSYEPRFMVCTRTDQLIHMEAAINGRRAECNLSFCCSSEHWKAAHALHHAPCEDAHDGPLSQCEMNLEVRAHLKFENILTQARGYHQTIICVPERVKKAWISLAGLSWESEFGDEMRKSFGVPPFRPIAPWIRAASDALTMAMTILYGLEKLNGDDAWTRKHTLTVHIIGANLLHTACAMVFEETLHCLPNVNTLKMVLCGPEMPQSIISVDCKTCSACTRLGRKHIHEHAGDMYHNFVQKKGSEFERPDLCIAFDSAAHPWPETFQLLVDRRIPTLFTAYNREEAEIEATLLRAAGATLHPALGPSKNPWGSMNPIPPAHRRLLYRERMACGWFQVKLRVPVNSN
ncbi:hypothetical protein B0H14DRAFT_3129318 [Mycena olivaceomarginata]|nr:hypothetical protein B0H14DRAFT_3129318 [Mycena olivaceomarginata]